MNLIPSIAHFFHVSIDELFGYENDRDRRVDTLAAEIDRMNDLNSGKDVCITECIALARSALVEFPGNEKLMLALASVLYKAGGVRYGECHLIDEEGYSVYDVEKHKTYEEWKEAIPLYEKVLQTLPLGKLRDRATEELSQLYLNFGEFEKGLALAELAPDMWNSREFLRAYACDGKAYVKAHSELLLKTVRASAVFIVNITAGDSADLDEIVRTVFVLNLDSKLLCKPDCKGLCSRCGKNLNDGPCGCQKEIDPRLAALKQLLTK